MLVDLGGWLSGLIKAFVRAAIGVACFKTSGVMSAIGQATLYEQVVDCNAYGVGMFMFPCDELRALVSFKR